MANKTVWECDNPECKILIDKPENVYHMILEGTPFYNGDTIDQKNMKLGFCERCTIDLKRILTRLHKEVTEKNE